MSDGVNDDELNKMIAGLQNGQAAPPVVTSNTGMPVVTPPVPPAPTDGTDPAAPAANPVAPAPAPVVAPGVPELPVPESTMPAGAAAQDSSLDSIKHDALNELRPLVDKLDLPPEEKFDTLLLLIRSTDDSSLVPAAHAAAKQIADESRRAQALLDIIKEIDFFGQNSAK